jgi:hypothetical protein
MTAPESSVDICNLALHHIGERSIASIENPTGDNEETMALWYDQVRREVLQKQVWNFAQKYTVLASAGDGDDGYTDKYRLPEDFIRLNTVGEDIYNPITDYTIDDLYIHADEGDSLPIRYNRDIEDVRVFSPTFIAVFALALAEKVAYKITKKKSVVDLVNALKKEAMPDAAAIDGQQRPPRRVQRSKLLTARRFSSNLNRDPRYYEYDV